MWGLTIDTQYNCYTATKTPLSSIRIGYTSKSAERSPASRPVTRLKRLPCQGQTTSPAKFTWPLLSDSPLCVHVSSTASNRSAVRTRQMRFPSTSNSRGLFTTNADSISPTEEKMRIQFTRMFSGRPGFFYLTSYP